MVIILNSEQKKKRNERQNTWQKENTDRINFTMPKGRKAEIQRSAQSKGISASEWINEAIVEKMHGGYTLDIKDLAAYARSAGMSEEEYIRSAVVEKMKRQDAEFEEDVTREKINDN